MLKTERFFMKMKRNYVVSQTVETFYKLTHLG